VTNASLREEKKYQNLVIEGQVRLLKRKSRSGRRRVVVPGKERKPLKTTGKKSKVEEFVQEEKRDSTSTASDSYLFGTGKGERTIRVEKKVKRWTSKYRGQRRFERKKTTGKRKKTPQGQARKGQASP